MTCVRCTLAALKSLRLETPCTKASLPDTSATARSSGALSLSVVGTSGQVGSGSVCSGRRGDKRV